MNDPSTLRWRILTAVHTFNAVTAMLGGGALAVWPDGSMLRAPPTMLSVTPFANYLVPGLLLFGMVGVTNMLAALIAYRREPGGEVVSFLAGVATLAWIVGEILVLQAFSWLQVVFVISALVIMVDAGWIRRSMRRAQPPRPAHA